MADVNGVATPALDPVSEAAGTFDLTVSPAMSVTEDPAGNVDGTVATVLPPDRAFPSGGAPAGWGNITRATPRLIRSVP